MWQLITVCVAFLLFISYNLVVFRLFGVPKSLSESFYLYKNKCYKSEYNHLGYIFTGFMFLMSMCLMPAWLEISDMWSSWSTNFTFLAFFAAASIAFVGAAPAFRKTKMEGTVHEVAAKVAAAASLIWCFVICYNIAYVPVIGAAIPAIGGWITKTWKTAQVYWLEMMAFGATFATVITAASILL